MKNRGGPVIEATASSCCEGVKAECSRGTGVGGGGGGWSGALSLFSCQGVCGKADNGKNNHNAIK